ncbi:MAG TPA: hypothetical protein PKE64_00460 [Anaerolineae bacterium]|nr:hypothetical protein [Anaerolineae bacterium]HMR62458.1 hypothetical protein [Anaerolineae bacterium]
MKLSFERNTDQNPDTIPYFLNIEIGVSELDWGRNFRVPILSYHGLKYAVQICGVEIKADTLRELGPKVQGQLFAIEYMSRLPTYVFITRRSRRIIPVYTIGDNVVAVTPQNVTFKHVELAKVREYLTDYLHQIGWLGPLERGDKLHVRGVQRNTLVLNRPAFYLKKRALGVREMDFWAPVFYSTTSNRIYAYAANTRHNADVDQGREVFTLRHCVAEALIADGRLTDNLNLRADRLMPDHWAAVKTHLERLPRALIYEGIKLPMYQGSEVTVALEYRSNEDRFSLYLGHNDTDLRNRVARDLIRRGFINDQNALYIQGV